MSPKSFTRDILTVFTVLFLFLSIGLQQEVQAKWHSQSDDLPGMSTGTVVLIGVGVTAAVVLLIYASKSGKKSQENTPDMDNQQEDSRPDSLKSLLLEKTGSDLNSYKRSLADGLGRDKKLRFMPYLGLQNPRKSGFSYSGPVFDFKEQIVVVGLAMRF